MNTRVRTALQTMKAPASKHEKAKQRTEEIGKSIKGEKTQSLRCSSRERKMALQQDVDMLRKKLKHEENVHRALERAFTRPLGALPRLPPYLPPYTLELLAEVAVLEEEVVRLEEQVVNFRQRLYQEAAYISSSSSKKHMESRIDFCDHPLRTLKRSSSSEITTSDSSSIPRFLHSVMEEGDEDFQFRRQSLLDTTVSDQVGHSPNDQSANGKQPWSSRAGLAEIGSLKKLHVLEDGRCGQENQKRSLPKSTKRNSKQSAAQNHASRTRNHTERSSPAAMVEKQPNLSKLQLEYRAGHETAQQNFPVDAFSMEKGESIGPNTISEEILKCLLSIFLKVSSPGMETMSSTATEISRSTSSGTNSGSSGTLSCKMPSNDCSQEIALLDPYGICSEFGERNIGPYKHLSEIGASTIDLNRVTNSVFLIRRLKFLLGKLGLVDLQGLSHQQKLAFWINIYNSCMMHAYLEYGIPDSPQMVVALMQKAIINVGGRSLNALTIEHFILRLPYHSPAKYTDSRGMKNDEVTVRSVFGLDWPEPLVTFALSCGSWSSPAVRVYTACNVEKELDVAKRDYLQAAVRVSTDNNQLGIPKLLDWYLLDFAKDVESLLDWICLQLPTVAREEAVKCVERGRSQTFSQRTQIIPYDFSFRYLLDGS